MFYKFSCLIFVSTFFYYLRLCCSENLCECTSFILLNYSRKQISKIRIIGSKVIYVIWFWYITCHIALKPCCVNKLFIKLPNLLKSQVLDRSKTKTYFWIFITFPWPLRKSRKIYFFISFSNVCKTRSFVSLKYLLCNIISNKRENGISWLWFNVMSLKLAIYNLKWNIKWPCLKSSANLEFNEEN